MQRRRSKLLRVTHKARAEQTLSTQHSAWGNFGPVGQGTTSVLLQLFFDSSGASFLLCFKLIPLTVAWLGTLPIFISQCVCVWGLIPACDTFLFLSRWSQWLRLVILSSHQWNNDTLNLKKLSSPRVKRAGCYWQTVPPQWGGGRLVDGSTKFFYRNCCNSGTESQKIVPKVGN